MYDNKKLLLQQNNYNFLTMLFLPFIFSEKKRRWFQNLPFVSPFLNHNNKGHILKYVILPSVYLSVIALLSTNPSLWVTSPIHHFYIELFGTILAGILAFYYISRARTFSDKFSLFIGIGFLVNALIDFLHVTVSLLNMDNILFLKYMTR